MRAPGWGPPPDFFEQTNRPALDQLQRLIESGESVVVRVAKPDDLKQLSKLNEEFHVQTHRHDPSDKDTRKLWSTALEASSCSGYG